MPDSVLIIGGGTGGYVAAIRASQLGAQVTLVEKYTLGGTCLNRGCIPTKALLHSTHVLEEIRNAQTFGISVGEVSINPSAVFKRKEAVVEKLVAGVSYLMRKNKIRVVTGVGTLIDPNTVRIMDTKEQLRADKIIIATGSKPSLLHSEDVALSGVITSDDCLALGQFPGSIIIIGGGVIGLEFAQIMHRVGSKVTVLEIMPQILPAEDTEMADMLMTTLKGEGIEIITDASVTDIRSDGKGEVVSFTIEHGGPESERSAEKVLLAVGREACTDDLGVNEVGLATDKGKLVVNERMETNVPGVYAVGDVVGKFMLAHVAMGEAKCAAGNCMGFEYKMDYRSIPRCVYTSPELAAVGVTEMEAREHSDRINIGQFPLMASGKAMILDQRTGFVKVISDAGTGRILGMQMFGPSATELVSEASLAVRLGATFEDVASTIHAHPTLSEAVMESALDVGKRAIHI